MSIVDRFVAALQIHGRISKLHQEVTRLNSLWDNLLAINAPEQSVKQVEELINDCKAVISRFNSDADASGHRKHLESLDLYRCASNLIKRCARLHERQVWPNVNVMIGLKTTNGQGGSSSSVAIARGGRPQADTADAEYVGIDGPKDMLTKWLLEKDKRLRVVSIVGPAGSGKKSLAKVVYRQTESQGKFHYKAELNASQPHDMEELLKKIWNVVKLVEAPDPSKEKPADALGSSEEISVEAPGTNSEEISVQASRSSQEKPVEAPGSQEDQKKNQGELIADIREKLQDKR